MAGFHHGRARRATRVRQAGYVQHLAADSVFFAFLFRDAAGAHAGFQSLRPTVTAPKELPVTGLGEEAVEGSDKAENQGGLHLWRQANLVVVAEWVCDSDCCFRAGSPARAYALEIDARAKKEG
jgi:hypothetical protein